MATVYSLVCWGGLSGKSVTANASTDRFTLTNHGLRNGTGVQIASGTVPAGGSPVAFALDTTYYARSYSANEFTLHTTAEGAIANTGQITFTSAGASLIFKSKKMLDYLASPPTTERWGTSGSERCYDGLKSWVSGRSGASSFDEEVCEIGESFTDQFTGTGATINVPSAKNRIETKVNGARSEAFHQGVIPPATLTLSSGYAINVAGVQLGSSSIVSLAKLRDSIDGIIIKSAATYDQPAMIQMTKSLQEAKNCILIGGGTGYGFGIQIYGVPLCKATNNVVQNVLNGINVTDYQTDNQILLNTVTRCGTGISAGTNSTGYYYDNLSIGNTTNWGTKPTTLQGASQNAGLTGEAWIAGSGSRIVIDANWNGATPLFMDYANNDLRPYASGGTLNANSTLIVESGVEIYEIPTVDIADRVRPDYMNGGAAAYDIGAYEFDHGYGPWPETLLTITNLTAGSTVRVFTTGTQTVLASDTNSGTSFTPSGLSAGTVDITILKDGLIPLRFAGVVLTSGTTQSVDGTQTLDRAFVASSGLTYGSTATINTGTSRFTLTTATTGQNWYSFWVEQFRSNSDLYNKEFPLQANGPNSFTLRKGYEFSAGLTYITRDGIRYTDTSGTRTAAWAALLSVGVPTGEQVRYEQTDGAALSNASNTGNIDQLVQIYGDASHGAIDYTGYLVCKVQAEGYDQAEVDVVAQYGTLEDQLYVIALTPAANGVAASNPTVSSVTITDHAGSPVTWNSKAFSITITDSGTTSGETILQWIRHAQEVGGTFQGKNAFNWHDLITTNGDKFKGVRGAIYGDTGAALKGVRVLRGTDAHPDFTIHTADDGTTVSTTPPAQATATVLANSRIQLYNVTTDAELDNDFVTGTTYANTLTSGVSVGDTLRMRVCKLGYEEAEAFSVWTANGCAFIVSQSESDVYTAWGIDGSTVTEYTLDVTGLIEIDANDVDGVSTKARVGAFYNYALTTEDGIRNAFGAMTFLSAAAIRINVDVCDLKLENVNATTALRFTDLAVRLFRSDGSSIISATSYSIHNDYSGVPDVVKTGISGLTGSESAQLMALPDAATTAGAVWGYTLP